MDAIALLDRAERTVDADRARTDRLLHMITAVRSALTDFMTHGQSPASKEAWEPILNDFFEWDRRTPDDGPVQHGDELEALVKRAYMLVLFERGTRGVDIAGQIPQTREEYDALPDALDELDRHRRAI